MRANGLALFLSLAVVTPNHAQTNDDLKNDHVTPGDVMIYGMGYDAQRYSPLTQIDKQNAAQLAPKWAYSLTDNRGIEGFPLFRDGLIYVTTHDSTTAVNVETGAQVWRVVHEYPPETLRAVCCGIVNRGAALYEGMLIRQLLDDQVIALDAKTGKEIWRVKSPPPASSENGYSMTGAPLVANGVVVVGVAGAEFGVRGFIEGYDAKTGSHLWRHWNVPAADEPGAETWTGDTIATGGGSSWITGTYDSELDLVYWGTGNPSPWSPLSRNGDALWTNAIVAIRPKTGERVWFYQASPGDPFDYDAVQQPVVATLPIQGKPTKVVMQADRNGFLYVLGAKDGKLLTANAYERVTWADGVDLATGLPRFTNVYKDALAGKKVEVWPSAFGATNWQSMAFSPRTGLIYVNAIHLGMTYQALPTKPPFTPGLPIGSGTARLTFLNEDPNVRGFLVAIEPLTGKPKWKVPSKTPNWAATLVTGSDLVFSGTMTGEFEARDADDGKLLYSFRTSSGILSQPITFEHKGKQYVAIQSGIGGLYAMRSGDPNLANIPAGSTLWVFTLPDR